MSTTNRGDHHEYHTVQNVARLVCKTSAEHATTKATGESVDLQRYVQNIIHEPYDSSKLRVKPRDYNDGNRRETNIGRMLPSPSYRQFRKERDAITTTASVAANPKRVAKLPSTRILVENGRACRMTGCVMDITIQIQDRGKISHYRQHTGWGAFDFSTLPYQR